MTTILINNEFIKKDEAKVSIFSDAFQRGHGVFETLRTYGDKKLFMANDHIARLFKSAEKVQIKSLYNKTEIFKQLEKVVKKSPHKLQRLKIILIKDQCIIFSLPLSLKQDRHEGVSIQSICCMRSLPEVKSISYLASYLSHEKASEIGAYDALLTSKDGEVFEGAYSNVFWFEDETLYTRKEEILKGITRKFVLENSPFKTRFKNINLEDLKKSKEVFLTQSVNGIIPVTKIDDSEIGKGKPGPKTNELIEIFKRATD